MKKKRLFLLALLAGGVCVSHAHTTTRSPQYKKVDPIFINRWSPRAMSGKAVSKDELMTIFEAARWAPSAYNSQPWRFVYAHKGTQGWDKLYSTLGAFNQAWVKNAGVLVLIVSRATFEHNGKPSRTHSFDVGAAWASMALQGSDMGLVVHAMSGFDYDEVQRLFAIEGDYSVEAMVAIGKPAAREVLPKQMRAMEKPSDRKPLEEFVFEGTFKA